MSDPALTSLYRRVVGTVPLDVVPIERRPQVGPDAPGPMRAMAARALMPLEPGELVRVLAYLGAQEHEPVALAALKTAGELPATVAASALREASAPAPVLAFFAVVAGNRSELLESIILNPATPDAAIVHLAEGLDNAAMLEIIARNDVRCLRHPPIIEKLYLNPSAPMAAVGHLVELAVRQGVLLEHLPGYREIQESILGAESVSASEASVTDEEFTQLLCMVADRSERRESDTELVAVSPDEEAEEKEQAKALWLKLKELNAQQKVRVAIIGDQTVRRYLIRDPRRMVAMAVLQNPKLTAREVTLFASQKALDEDVVRAIARNREWTRHYATRLALVKNPKTPSQVAMTFLQGLQERDVKLLKKDKEIPGYIQRQAGQLLLSRERKRG